MAVDEAAALARQGVDVIFIGAVGPVCPELQITGIRVVCLDQAELIQAGGNPAVMAQGLWNATAYRTVTRELNGLDRRHTIVHLHGYTKALTSSAVRAAAKAGFQLVCTLHDFFPACPNGAFFDYQERVPCLRHALSVNCITTNCDKRHYAHKVYRVARSVVQRGPGMLPSGIRHYVTLSEGSAAILKPYLPQDSHFYPLQNIIEVPKSEPVKVGMNTDIVVVGRLDVEKGVELMVGAARKAGVRITFVGDGPLRSVAETYEQCRVTGWVNAGAVVAELEKARCLAFPSLWYETFGLVVDEAAAKGVPAIVSDISAAAERVEHGVTGWRMRSGDMDDLARYLALTRDDAIVSAMGQAAYDRFWRNPPTGANHVEGLSRIYDQVLSRVA